MFVSIHIPKTAGTTIGYILDYGFRRRIFYDYSQLEGPKNKAAYDLDRKLISEHKEFIERKFDVVHGHFYYKKYADIFPEAKYITCLRKPIKRTISQYFHIMEEADDSHWLYEDICSGKMDFVDFAKLPNIVRAQSMFTEGRGIKEYDHIFITEKLLDSIHQFQIIHSFERYDAYMNQPGELSIPKINIREDRSTSRASIPEKLIIEAEGLLAEDNDLYRRAEGKFIEQAEMAKKILMRN